MKGPRLHTKMGGGRDHQPLSFWPIYGRVWINFLPPPFLPVLFKTYGPPAIIIVFLSTYKCSKDSMYGRCTTFSHVNSGVPFLHFDDRFTVFLASFSSSPIVEVRS